MLATYYPHAADQLERLALRGGCSAMLLCLPDRVGAFVGSTSPTTHRSIILPPFSFDYFYFQNGVDTRMNGGLGLERRPRQERKLPAAS